MSGNSSTDVYIAGAGIYHSNNSSTWTVWASGSFSSVFAAAPGDIWSSYYLLSGASSNSAINRYQATGWAPVMNSDGSQALELQRIWGSSSSDMYAFGATEMCGLGACNSTAEVLYPDSGGTWSPQYSLNQPGPTLTMTSMWGFGKPLNNLYATLNGHLTPLHSAGDGNWTALGGSAPSGTSCVWGGRRYAPVVRRRGTLHVRRNQLVGRRAHDDHVQRHLWHEYRGPVCRRHRWQ